MCWINKDFKLNYSPVIGYVRVKYIDNFYFISNFKFEDFKNGYSITYKFDVYKVIKISYDELISENIIKGFKKFNYIQGEYPTI